MCSLSLHFLPAPLHTFVSVSQSRFLSSLNILMYFVFFKNSLYKIQPITLLLSALQDAEDITALPHVLQSYNMSQMTPEPRVSQNTEELPA